MISNFIPELWSAIINEAFRKALVYGALCNRDYEGEIQNAGDTVHITAFSDPTIRDYTPESNITVDSISDTTLALLVDQLKYWAFDVDDVSRKQALPGWIESVASRGSYKMKDAVDTYVAGLLKAAVDGVSGQDLGSRTADISDNTFYGTIVDLGAVLDTNNVPEDGRWVVVPPTGYAALLQDNRFINAAASGSTDPLRNGQVGSIVGFTVFKSNNVPTDTTGVYDVIAGHSSAITFADQLQEVKAQERELRFGELVKALHVYGAKVIRPQALAMASVTVQA